MTESTKERILKIALELFAQNGYLGTSMNDIAGQLGFTKAALYKHYASKQEILDKIVEQMNTILNAIISLPFPPAASSQSAPDGLWLLSGLPESTRRRFEEIPRRRLRRLFPEPRPPSPPSGTG